jgi:hypothetical protein
MSWFWFWIALVFLAIVGLTVLIAKMTSGPKRDAMTRQQQVTALKASGALRHRKSNRE